MVSFIYNVVVASLLGMLAGMGVGGGSLLLLWLTQVAMIETTQCAVQPNTGDFFAPKTGTDTTNHTTG